MSRYSPSPLDYVVFAAHGTGALDGYSANKLVLARRSIRAAMKDGRTELARGTAAIKRIEGELDRRERASQSVVFKVTTTQEG